MALKLSDLVKKSIEKGYGAKDNNIEKPWTQGNLKQSSNDNHRSVAKDNNLLDKEMIVNSLDNSINNTVTQFQHNNTIVKLQNSSNEYSNNVVTKSQDSDNESDNNVETKERPFDNEGTRHIDKTYLNLQTLSGIQLIIFDRMLSIKNKINKEYYVQVNTTSLAAQLGLSVNVLRVSIGRIVAKNLLVREPGFMGRNGSSNFKIPNVIIKYKDEISQIKKTLGEHNSVNTVSNIEKDSQIQTSVSQEMFLRNSQDTNWWNKLNLSPIEDYGFKHAQFKQLDGLNNPEVIQESINHFGWGLENNNKNEKYKENPSRILLSVLKKGSAWIEDGYKDPKELAMEQLIESKKRSIERKKKLEEEIYSMALDEWIESLTQEEIESIAQRKNSTDITPQRAKLSLHFKENIWSLKKVIT
jgi:hypothetical protein